MPPPEPTVQAPHGDYKALLRAILARRGYSEINAEAIAAVAHSAAFHGVYSHAGSKYLSLDSKHCRDLDRACEPHISPDPQNCRGAPGPYAACEAAKAVASEASRLGLAVVSLTGHGHYLWGGYYALQIARHGLIAFTTCTTPSAEVVPHRGTRPALGTNPWTWAFPTRKDIGFDILADWATSRFSMSAVDRLRQLDIPLPSYAAIDKKGAITRDPNAVHGLLPAGGHKGYSLALLTELFASYAGGQLPSRRSQSGLVSSLFLAIDPAVLGAASRLPIDDILRANPSTRLPGQAEFEAAQRCREAGALIIPRRELDALNHHAEQNHLPLLSP